MSQPKPTFFTPREAREDRNLVACGLLDSASWSQINGSHAEQARAAAIIREISLSSEPASRGPSLGRYNLND